MKKAYISKKACIPLKEYLLDLDYTLIEFDKGNQVYHSISDHPDIYMCKINDKYIKSDNDLGYSYPENVKYNGVQIGNFFVHNTDYTSESLLNAAISAGLRLVKVKQGYTKCNIVVVDDNSIITSDVGIKKALEAKGIDILLISQGSVILEGFDYGFLGGASGKVGKTILFNGDLSHHPDYYDINAFIEKKGVKIKYFPGYPLEDIGSIFTD